MNIQHNSCSQKKNGKRVSSLKTIGSLLSKIIHPEPKMTLEEWARLEAKPIRKKEIHLQRWM